jgi:hypothetical protein
MTVVNKTLLVFITIAILGSSYPVVFWVAVYCTFMTLLLSGMGAGLGNEKPDH